MNPIVKRKHIISLLILFLLLFSVGSILYKKNVAGNTPGVANIYQDGILIKSIPLTKDYSTAFVVEGKNGAFNKIEISDGQIAVTEASCPDHICISQGAINNYLIPITCLPNHLVISVETKDTSDMVAY